jgi:anti-anti-sigma regulatory factor
MTTPTSERATLVEIVSLALHAAEDYEALLRALCDPAIARGACCGVLGLREHDDGPLRTVACFGTSEGAIDLDGLQALVPRQAEVAGELVLIREAPADLAPDSERHRVLTAMNARVALALPLSAGTRGAGLALIGWAVPGILPEELVSGYRQLARHAGLALRTCVLIEKIAQQERNQEQLRLGDTLIAAQAAMLAERTMPLIPISDEILIMPIIGSVDSLRAEQMMDALLEGVASRGSRYAILDITGVTVVDSQAASGLMKAAHAVRLLGVEAVLTGFRAEVAQTVVRLGISLTGILTFSTVQRGIAYAMERRSRRKVDPELE